MLLRRGLRPALLTAVVGAASLALGTPAALAADPGGNNGTVKIGELTIDEGMANRPHVPCDFEVRFYDFDKDQAADITFTVHPPSGSGVVLLSEHKVISDDEAGGGQDEDAVLAYSGTDFDLGRFTRQENQGYHVKLDIQFPGVPGGKKHKVFWLDCAAPTPGPSGSPTSTPSGSPTPTPSVTPSSPGGGSGTPSLPPTTPTGDDSSLPLTGTATAGIALLGVALLGGGAVLLAIRRRRITFTS